jgi:uncharacterized protein (TIRG00374 family)
VTAARPARRSSAFLDWKAVLGFAISAGLVWYTFKDVDPGVVWTDLKQADLPLLVLATFAATLSFPLRAIRWGPLLRPALPASRFHSRFAATCIGFMVNNLLPARVGEFARAYALSRLEPVKVSASFGSLVVERMFDGIVLALLLLVSLAWPGFPDVSGRDFGTIALWMAGIFMGAFVLLLAMVIRPEASVRLFGRTVARILPEALRRPVVDTLAAFLDGLAALRDGRLVAEIAAWSVVTWLVGAASFWLGFMAFGIHLPFVAALFVQGLIALAVALPSAPGYFGVFEAAAKVGLVRAWGVASAPALAFAIGFHIAGFIPVTIIGLYYLWRLGISWRDVETSEDAVESAVEAASDGPGTMPHDDGA